LPRTERTDRANKVRPAECGLEERAEGEGAVRLRQARRLIRIEVLGLLTIAAVAAFLTIPAFSADHLDAPTVKTDGRIDINDVYVFHPGSPQNLSRTVLAMTVNPAAGVISGTSFRAGANYEFLIDKDGDAKPEGIVRVQFNAPSGGQQTYKVHVIRGNDGNVIVNGTTNQVVESEGVKVFAGLRDDPFFFDLAAFNRGADFCHAGLTSDFFMGLNASAIVIELPTSMLGGGQVGVWGRTVVADQQLERMGRPAILTVFIPPNPFEAGSTAQGNLEDQFNATQPKDDQATWRGEIVNTLLLLGNSSARANALANVLLPDILTVDLSQQTAFLNGRAPADDVIDAELNLLTNGGITSDCIANDSTFLSGFPYLGVPN
jgi:hypothetical protein